VGFELLLQDGDGHCPVLALAFGLLGVVAKDLETAPFAVAGDDLLLMEVLLEDAVRPRLPKTSLRISATLDMLQTRRYLPHALNSSLRFFRIYARVDNNQGTAQVLARQVGTDHLDGRHSGGVARQGPVAHGSTLAESPTGQLLLGGSRYPPWNDRPCAEWRWRAGRR
jgi:hypothetical protein